MEKNKILYLLSKITRILTLAPILALSSSLIIYFSKSNYYASVGSFITSILLLVILPLLAYPLFYIVKKFKEKGRPFQRKLAIIFAYISYLLIFILSFIFNDSWNIRIYYLTYLISGIVILLSSKFFHFNISGHAAGVVGPIVYLSFYVSPFYLFALLLFVLVIISSLYMKRHTFIELIIGGLLPTSIIVISFLIQMIF